VPARGLAAEIEPVRVAAEAGDVPPLAQRSALRRWRSAATKKLMNDIEDASLSLAIELEGQCYGRLRSSDDFREGRRGLSPASQKPRCTTHACGHRSPLMGRFVADSLLEGNGFERSVPRRGKHCCRGLTYASRAKSRKQRYRRSARGELVSAAGPTPPIKAVSSQV
jgi:hypothetical protein